MNPCLDVAGLADRYRTGALRPSQVIAACLDCIAELDPRLGAFITVMETDARHLAAEADAALAAGRPLGPLHGIPFAVKDIYDMEGQVTGKGQLRSGLPAATRTAPVVRSLISAGAIPLGRTRTVELAMGGWGINAAVGTPWNPRDMATHRVPGGSSAGSAVAVAAGMASFALGSDTGGSVRIPASFCGVSGLHVTAHTLSTEGIMPLSATLDSPGPITRTVRDAAILFDVLQGRTPAPHVPGGDLTGLRLAAIAPAERAVCTPEVLAAYDAVLEDLRRLGAMVDVLHTRRSLTDMVEGIGELIDAEAFAAHGHDYRTAEFHRNAYVHARLDNGSRTTPAQRNAILQRRAEVQRDFAADFEGFDALVTPTTPTVAVPVAAVQEAANPSHFTRPINFLGMCATAQPIGLTSGGLPTSLQVAARGGAEGLALRIATAVEEARGPLC